MQINKNELLKRTNNKIDRITLSNALDKLIKYEKTGISSNTNFLDIRSQKIVEDTLKKIKADYNVYKAHEECEKTIIYFGDYQESITIYKIVGEFKHSEVLGTLFSLGIEDDQIGDIFIEDGHVYITVLTRLKELYESSLYTISNKKIKLEIVNEIILKRERYEYFNIIVPSMRLDCIVAKLGNMGRKDAQDYIKDGFVLVNYQETNSNKNVSISDILSIRKKGKFILFEENNKTKKDNYIITIKKYN